MGRIMERMGFLGALPIRFALVLATAGALFFGAEPVSASHLCTPESGGCGMDAMSIDMDAAAAPANTATNIGSIENCARINENDVLDADEDILEDTVTFDVTAQGIRPYNDGGTPSDRSDDIGGITGWQYTVAYSDANLTTVYHNPTVSLVNANSGSDVAFGDWSGGPDATGYSFWESYAFDQGAGIPESGSGVLRRQAFRTDTIAATDVYSLIIGDAYSYDTGGAPLAPET